MVRRWSFRLPTAGSARASAARSPASRRRLAGYRFDFAATALYEFAWYDFCDWYLELAKTVLQADGATAAARRAARATLAQSSRRCSARCTRFMPFITEEIWQRAAPLAGRSGDSDHARALSGRGGLSAGRGGRARSRMDPRGDPRRAPDPRRDEHQPRPAHPAAAAGRERAGRAVRRAPPRLARAAGGPRRARDAGCGRARAAVGECAGGHAHAARADGRAHRRAGGSRAPRQAHRQSRARARRAYARKLAQARASSTTLPPRSWRPSARARPTSSAP